MNGYYKDCYASFEGEILIIGNESIERAIAFKNSIPVTQYIQNRKTGYKWFNPQGNDLAAFNLPVLNFEQCKLRINTQVLNNNGLSESFLSVVVDFIEVQTTVKWHLDIYPDTPFISSGILIKCGKSENNAFNIQNLIPESSSGIENYNETEINNKQIQLPESDVVDAFCIYNNHLKLETMMFFDVTDVNDNLVSKYEELVYPKSGKSAAGNAFIIKSYLDNEGLMIVKEGLTADVSLNRKQNELLLKPCYCVQLTGTGLDYSQLAEDEFIPCYGSTVGVGHMDEMKRLYKKHYSKCCKGYANENLFIMSNTWGDRNQDKAICEEFIMKEIVAAKEIGVDIVQIDDGWENGITANSALSKGGVWEGYYDHNPDFWKVNGKKFPRGLRPVVDAAREYDTEIGLWFSPDSSRDFKNWEKDGEILLSLYREYGIRHFKLDGIKIRNKMCEINLIKLMQKVALESNNQISLNLDITAEVRFGYFYEKQYGTLFVENRYTDWGNYYPHRTLKNLWQLSEIFPARKFQFELLNNKRNINKYENDVLAPHKYSMDYIFAITMLSNPLVWMEMSSLRDEDKEALKNIIEVYKNERKNLFSAEVIPIGNMPDGISFTGFQAVLNDNEGYMLLFRELAASDCFEFKVYNLEGKKITIDNLYSNCESKDIILDSHVDEKGYIKVQIKERRSFILAKYQVI